MDPELRDLVAAWIDGDDPGADRRAALLARLRADPAFRGAVAGELHLHGLRAAARAAGPRKLSAADQPGPVPPIELADADALIERLLWLAAATRARRRKVVRRVAAAAAAVIAVCLMLSPWGRSRPEEVGAARVAHLDAVEWGAGQQAVAEGGPVAAGPFRLKSGRLTLAFASGVLLAVEGPVDLDLADRDRVYCRRGKLRARVPAGAEGFTIAAAGCEVVDLGTEFGLNVEPGQMPQLMVFEGQTSVSVLNATGQSVRSELVTGPRAVEVDTEHPDIHDVPPEPDQFTRLPDALAPALDLPPGYRDAVLSAGPWGYWRFDRLDAGRVPNEVPGRPALRAEGGVRLGGGGGRNTWAVFSDGRPEQLLTAEADWTPPRAGGYAIEVWVQSDSLDTAVKSEMTLVAVVARDDAPPDKHMAVLELRARTPQAPDRPCVVRFTDRWPAGAQGGVYLFSRRTYVATTWHHLVGQKSGGVAELYIDGERVAWTPAMLNAPDATSATGPGRILVGRHRLRPLETPADVYSRAFRGRLDELAVYDRALTPDEVRAHAARGGSTASSGPNHP